MKGHIEKQSKFSQVELDLLTEQCKTIEDNAHLLTEAQLAKEISEMHYNTRVFLRPELKQIINENQQINL